MEYNGYRPGYIYVLKSGPYYKIGFADDVEQRMKTVATAAGPDLPEPPVLLYTFATKSKLIAERTLHDFLRQSRVKGEWFQLSGKQVELLEEFARGYSVGEFVMQLHRLPQDQVLFSKADIEFCKKFKIVFIGSDGADTVTFDDLEDYIDREKAGRGRKQRGERYQDLITKLLSSMSVDDLEWIYESIMLRGVTSENE